MTSTRRFIQRASALPVYRQVADRLEAEMRNTRDSGVRTALPSENELAAAFKVSRVTVRQALDELHRKGLIFREKGRGSYARAQHIAGVTGFGSFTSEVEEAGSTPSSRFVGFETVASLPAAMQRHLAEVPAAAEGFFLVARVRCVNDRPVAFEEAYLDAQKYPGLTRADVETGSLYAAMKRLWGHDPAWADAAIEPSLADARIAALLDIPIGAPVVVAWRVTSSEHDEVLEYVRAVYRGEGFALTLRRHKIV